MRVRPCIFDPRDLRLIQSILRLSPANPCILPSIYPKPLPIPQRCSPFSTTVHMPAKTKTVKTLQELQQGVVQAEVSVDVEEVEDEAPYPPVVLQARNNMLKFSNCVVLTRVGNFYEVTNHTRFVDYMYSVLTEIALSRTCKRVCITTEPQTWREAGQTWTSPNSHRGVSLRST